jgi:hypothetical protein
VVGLVKQTPPKSAFPKAEPKGVKEKREKRKEKREKRKEKREKC